MAKLMANERTAKYFENPDFLNKFEAVKKDPEMFQQLLQTDPRFMDVFSTITGIDLMKMQEEQLKQKDNQESAMKRA